MSEGEAFNGSRARGRKASSGGCGSEWLGVPLEEAIEGAKQAFLGVLEPQGTEDWLVTTR